MKKFFEIKFLDKANEFLNELDEKTRIKIIYNIDKAGYTLDKEIFKKLTTDIWEFRTLFNKISYRLLAFWDKTEKTKTFVICSHGFLKKSQKTPKNEIEKAENNMRQYFKNKINEK